MCGFSLHLRYESLDVFIEKENNLNETNSTAEKACRESMAKAGYAFGAPVSFHWSQLTNPNGKKEAAIDAYQTLLEQEAENKSALEGVAYLFQIMGNQERALYFRRRLKAIEACEYGISESNKESVINYLLARTGEAEMPDRAPSDFVSAHFDKYSEQFDSSLIEDLSYMGPQLINKLVDKLFVSNEAKIDILDLGCGTGLIGETLSSRASALIGVDLSSSMLEKAAARHYYDNLIQDDCITYLANTQQIYTLITAVDMLIYLGDLSVFFSLVCNKLIKNGHFIFTIEDTDLSQYRLSNSGRYQHNCEYIHQLANKNKFDIAYEKKVDLRKERGSFINATLFCLKTSS